MESSYEVIVIGSGQGGVPLAEEFAGRNKKTLLIEMDLVGGTCINRGCTPTKAMIASAEAAYNARRTQSFGVISDFQSVDLKQVKDRKRQIVETFRNSDQKKIQATQNLDLVFGKAVFLDARHLEIDLGTEKKVVKGSLIFINTGGRPKIPHIPGLEEISFFDSTSLMEIEELPEHLIVIGGSYISLEFSQMFCRFGSKITILERSSRLLMREDPDISGHLHEIFRQEGIEIICNAMPVEVGRDEKNTIFVLIENKGEKQKIRGSHLFLATGRTPNTEMLQTEAAGISIDEKGYIRVNEKLQTNVPHIYALGDVKGGPAFTHISYDDYRIIRDNFFKKGRRTIKDRFIPYVIFTDPQLGRIGLSEEEAKDKQIPYQVAKMPMNYVARAIETGSDKGIMKVLVQQETGEILGCSILGSEGGEIMSMIEIAMLGKIKYYELQDAIFAHPTLAESLNNLFYYLSE
ncbi:MAG: mercuric reductase [Simkaniaceae bacterium]